MKVFTIVGSANYSGAYVSKLPFYNKNETAIVIGSSENGCKLGFVKVKTETEITEIHSCTVEMDNGKQVIHPQASNRDESKCLVILRTPVYKGGKNFHTGDRKNCMCLTCGLEFGITQDTCTNCGKRVKVYFQDFPGVTIAKGTVRDSKKPVFGEQLIAILKKNQVIRTAFDGYTFGKPGCYYHWFDGSKLISCTWEERLRFHNV